MRESPVRIEKIAVLRAIRPAALEGGLRHDRCATLGTAAA